MSDYRPLILYFTQKSRKSLEEMGDYSGRRQSQRSTRFGVSSRKRASARELGLRNWRQDFLTGGWRVPL